MLILVPYPVCRSPLNSNVSYLVSLLNHENKHLPRSKNLLSTKLNGVTGKGWLGKSGRRGRSSGSCVGDCTRRQYAWGFGISMSVHHVAVIYFSRRTNRQLLRIEKDSELLYNFFSQTRVDMQLKHRVKQLRDVWLFHSI